MTYNYTETFRLAMELSFQRAKELGAVEITPDLLLYGIIRQESTPCMEYLRQNGIDTQYLLDKYEDYITNHTPRSEDSNNPILGDVAASIIMEAVRRCTQEEAVSPMHLLQVLFEGDYDSLLKHLHEGRSFIDQMRERMNAEMEAQKKKMVQDITQVFQSLRNKLQEQTSEDEDDEEEDEGEELDTEQSNQSAGRGARGRSRSRSKTPMIDRFGRDITALAREGQLDPVIGREVEIERMCHILGRRRKCNPILIGEPGVGKTSLVEGLAHRIVRQEVPRHLLSKRLVEIDLSAMVAGTKYRGQFEERIKELVEELEACSDVIIYLDEIHTMVGAGGGSSSMDAANMLKPALARGVIQCIGATTLEEYRKHIERDRALERRFQKIVLEPSSAEETLQILHQLRPHYEAHHQVRFSDDALSAMVQLAERYINDRHFPDKAIDLMDEAGAKLGSRIVEQGELSPLTALEKEKAECLERKLNAIKEQKFELAASYRNKERELEQAISQAKEELKKQVEASYTPVEVEHIAEVLAQMTSIPVQNIASGERERLRNLEPTLSRKVIGQGKAVEAITRSIKRNRLGLRDSKRPIGTFLFLGPTGVGKTYLVKCLAEQMFGSTDALIRVDMSEYMEKFAVSRLVGAPPGYVGHDEGGQLTEQVRRRPYSIVLFDEVEKAHADVYNLLLQVLDEGYLTDSYGRRVDFRNTIIVLTSNVGSREARSFARGIGYQDEDKQGERTADIIRKSLNKTFSPEFLNRLDDIITFEPLSEEAIRQIVDLELAEMRTRLTEMGYGLHLDEAALTVLAKQAYHPEYGARPLRRTLQSEIEDRLTDLILDGGIQAGETLSLTAVEGKITRVKQ